MHWTYSTLTAQAYEMGPRISILILQYDCLLKSCILMALVVMHI